ncbi:hypothetical protein ACEW7V_01415 [Areca yellow leaf disease phytoplasma]
MKATLQKDLIFLENKKLTLEQTKLLTEIKKNYKIIQELFI